MQCFSEAHFCPKQVKVLLQGGEEELLWDLASNSQGHRAQYGKVLEKLLSALCQIPPILCSQKYQTSV